MNKQSIAALLLLAVQLDTAAVYAAEPIRSFEPDSFARIVAGHKGKPFVLMVWSLDCDYCQASFSALAEAKRKRNLDVVTIAADRADDAETARLIKNKLAPSGLTANVWAFGSAPAERLRYAIDPGWRGEMPRSYWFNARGESVAYSGLITADKAAKFLPK
ncbi:MAG: redoxin protein [Herminiimonas sp.]|nr:redoxin protein [Herminiimonas sp.]